jgi:hypothetical protein
MVWKHVVQIESIDASGFLLWANGIRVFIYRTLLSARRFRDGGDVAVFGEIQMSRLGLSSLAVCAKLNTFAKYALVVSAAR